MPKPRPDLADTFRFPGVAEAYRSRPAYPREAIDLLVALAGGEGARVLDLGAGEGALARPLAARVARVDAVEPSAAMVDVGRTLPGGDAAALVWHVERAEDVALSGPFDLVVAGAAMHWFDLEPVCRSLRRTAREGAFLALCDRSARHPGLGGVVEVIRRFSRAPEFDPGYDVANDLVARGLWTRRGERRTDPVELRQSPRAYLAGLRSTSTLARELMSEEENDAFDREVLRLVEPLADDDGMIGFEVTATIAWGVLTAP